MQVRLLICLNYRSRDQYPPPYPPPLLPLDPEDPLLPLDPEDPLLPLDPEDPLLLDPLLLDPLDPEDPLLLDPLDPLLPEEDCVVVVVSTVV
mgnify:CR=1 FL=1